MEGLAEFLTMTGVRAERHGHYRRKLEGFANYFPNKTIYTCRDMDEYCRTHPAFLRERPAFEKYLRLQMRWLETAGPEAGTATAGPSVARLTILDAVAKYVSHRARRGCRPGTIEGDRYRLRVIADFLTSRQMTFVDEVDRGTITAFKDHLFRTKHSRGRHYQVAQQRAMLQFANLFFAFLVQEERIRQNPCAGLSLPRTEKRVSRNLLSRNEMDDFLAAIDTGTIRGFLDRTIFELLYSTGMRIGEVRNLKLCDLRLEDNLITIIDGKGGKDRVAVLTMVSRRYLESFVRDVRPKYLHKGRDSEYLFPTWNGRRPKRTFLLDKIRMISQQAGIEHHISPHAFRRSFATHLVNEGVDIRHVQQLMGHETVEATMHYIQLATKDLHNVLIRCHPREKEMTGQEILFRGREHGT